VEARGEPPPLRREPARLGGRFDLLVVGGGIYGAWIACDAARRGLAVALIEQGDWAQGASSASSKLIHGGLRYLEYGHLGLVRKSLAERARLLRLAPHRVRPLRFVAPLWDDSRASPWKLALGLTVYDALAALGPAWTAAQGALPRHQRLGAAALAAAYPYLAPGLRAGFTYGDASEDDARFALEIVAAAQAAGAVTVNRCAATRLIHQGPAVVGALVEDRRHGAATSVQAAVTVLAAGAWTPGLLAGLPSGAAAAPRLRRSRGIHLVLPPLPPGPEGPGPEKSPAFLLTTRAAERRSRRVFFLIPWQGVTLLGTTDEDWQGPPGAVPVSAADVDHLLAEASARCPGLGWTRAQVRAAFAGERTLVDARTAGTLSTAVSREWELAAPCPGLLASLGGKYTSARVEAAHAVDRVLHLLGRAGAPCATAELPFPWRPAGERSGWLAAQVAAGTAIGLDGDCARTVAERLGACVPALHRRLRADPGLARRIVPGAPVCLGEAVHAVVHEMALDLDDILRRRLALALTAPPSAEAVLAVANAVAPVLGWTPEQAAAEAVGWSRRPERHAEALE
jgi:glycerol-3-phosphate dehydrogenase